LGTIQQEKAVTQAGYGLFAFLRARKGRVLARGIRQANVPVSLASDPQKSIFHHRPLNFLISLNFHFHPLIRGARRPERLRQDRWR